MKLLADSNTKLKATSKHFDVKIFNFNIPAYNDKRTGKVTCPFAVKKIVDNVKIGCGWYCYADKNFYKFSNVQNGLSNKYQATKNKSFVDDVIKELNSKRTTKQIYVRIHDAGDFYSPAYLDKWVDIATALPHIRFYAYTKSHDFFGLFLNTWLGARPPSSVFKASILGQAATVDSSMMASYESLTASNTRINDLKEWNRKEQSKTKKKTVTKKIPAKKLLAPIKKKSAAIKTIAKKAEPIIIETQPQYVDTTELIESADMATTIAAEHTQLDFDENTVEATSLKKAMDTNGLGTKTASDKSALVLASNTKNNDLANKALADINQEKKQLLRFYRSTILTSTYKKIVYPSSAIDKNQQGKVVLKVIVDRSGKVQSIDLKEKSQFKLLNKAANRAVTKAHFPSVPSELEGDEFEFLLPIKFSLN